LSRDEPGREGAEIKGGETKRLDHHGRGGGADEPHNQGVHQHEPHRGLAAVGFIQIELQRMAAQQVVRVDKVDFGVAGENSPVMEGMKQSDDRHEGDQKGFCSEIRSRSWHSVPSGLALDTRHSRDGIVAKASF